MEAELRAQAALENDVRQAVAHGEIEPHYQPLIKLRRTAWSASRFWPDGITRRGDVPPDVFIPIVERLGLIAELTYWLLRRACREHEEWPREITIALNVSPFHLCDPLLPVKFCRSFPKPDFHRGAWRSR